MRSIYVVLTIAIMSSCAQVSMKPTAEDMTEWTVSKVPRRIQEIEIGIVELRTIEILSQIFTEKPYLDYSPEIRIDRVFENPANSTTIYAFFIRGAHDIWAVFVVDSNGGLIDNFVLSRFDMYEER